MSSVAVMIDADNVATAAQVEEAFRHLSRMGMTVTVGRAYGGHEKLAGLKDVLRRFGARSLVNQGRGTTDVALVIDTMDLLHQGRLPETVVICSSDADFAPLAVRLREAGTRVICFAAREKADADALDIAYDEVIFVGEPQAGEWAEAVPQKAPPRGRSRAVRPPAEPAAAAKGAAARPDAAAILRAVPALATGARLQLNVISKPLRDAKILVARNAGPASLLRPLVDEFRLTPELKPTHVQWIGKPSR